MPLGKCLIIYLKNVFIKKGKRKKEKNKAINDNCNDSIINDT